MRILQNVDTEAMRDLRARGEFFWLDLLDPSVSDLDTLRDFVTIHPLAHQDTIAFGQRAKLDDHPGSSLLVFYGVEHATPAHRGHIFRHLVPATGLIDSYREQLGGLLDLYLAEVSNRLNVVMKRLTVIATVFLPLTFLTGFFGMNFGWLVQQITPTWTFFVFGVALLVASAAVVVCLGRAGR